MSWLSRLGNVFRSSRLNQDLDDELRFHVQARAEELEREGLAPEAAEAEARRQLGNALRLREESRDVKLLPWLESLIQDVRFGSRMLRKDAVVTGAAVVSLALAIGAATAAFALVDALILRSLAVSEPERLVYLTFAGYDSQQPEGDGFNYPLFERMRNDGRAHVDLFGMGYATMRRAAFAAAGGEEERVRTQYVSGNTFEILGVRSAHGRLLGAADDVTPDAHPVALLSHAFWTRRFGANPAVVGQWFTFRERSIQIVGVAQPGFAGVEPGRLVDFWLPNMMWPRRAFTEPGWSWFRILGRLKPGADSARARAVLQSTFTQFRHERALGFRADEPRERVERFLATPLMLRSARNGPSQLRRDFERPLWILATVVALVLLIAGSNVANLLLARAAAREREMSLRLSIGAGRGRLVQQVLIESGLLAGAACLLGLGFAFVAGPAVVAMLAPSDNPAHLDLRLDARVVAFLGIVGALTAVLFGLAPALRASNVAPMGALKAGGSRLSSRRAVLRPLVALQVAFSLVVLFVGGLLSLSFRKLAAVDVGFDQAGLLLLDVESPALREEEEAHRAALQLLAHVRQQPGVDAASLSAWALFGGSSSTRQIRVPEREPEPFEPYHLDVSPGFFQTMGIRLLEGRDFRPSDAETAVPSSVVVNQAFARRYFGREPALGRVFSRVEREGVSRQEIVGVVADARYGDGRYADLRRPPSPTVYVPWRGLGTLQVRTALDPLALAATLRPEIATVHPSLRVTGVNVQSTLVGNTLLRERLLALLSGFFATVGLVLAAVGLYGVLSYAVVQRTKEIGIRLALGARPLTVVRGVLAETGWMTLVGVAGGLAGGVYLARFLTTLLYEVRPLEPWSLGLPIGCLLAVGALAAVRPAWLAARVDPVVALRYE